MKPRKKRRPSYETGELRDKNIEKLQDPNYQKNEFLKLARRSAKSRQKSQND